MTQKIIKVGTSAAVTIPKEDLEKIGVAVGDAVERITNENGVLFRPVKSPIKKETVSWTEKFLKEYGPALRELSKK